MQIGKQVVTGGTQEDLLAYKLKVPLQQFFLLSSFASPAAKEMH